MNDHRTRHFLQRVKDRGISWIKIRNAVEDPERIDSFNDGYEKRIRDGVVVVMSHGGNLVTVYEKDK